VYSGCPAGDWGPAEHTQLRCYLRLAAMFIRDYPVVNNWRDVPELPKLEDVQPGGVPGGRQQADRYQLGEERTIALDLATMVTAKANHNMAVAALITLTQDKEIAAAVRELTPKVTACLCRGCGGVVDRCRQPV
jgi:hypothetical protein